MRFFLFLSVNLLMFGYIKDCYSYSPSPKEILADEIIYKAAMQLKKDKNLVPCGTGGSTMDRVKMLYLAFDYYHKMEIEEARDLLLKSENIFINAVNEDRRIHPYLNNYPFQPKNIEMRIFFKNPDGSKVENGELSLIVITEGRLRYEAADPKIHLKTIHTETYEEALEKLKKISL